MMGAFDNAKNEAVQPTSAGDMYSAKGKTIVSPKEGGLYSLSDNDEFAAAPGLGDMINRPQQTSATVVQDNSSLLNEMKELNRNTILTNQGIAQLYSKNTNIYMGPNKVGQLLTQNNYNLA
jgi:hypothetical protein